MGMRNIRMEVIFQKAALGNEIQVSNGSSFTALRFWLSQDNFRRASWQRAVLYRPIPTPENTWIEYPSMSLCLSQKEGPTDSLLVDLTVLTIVASPLITKSLASNWANWGGNWRQSVCELICMGPRSVAKGLSFLSLSLPCLLLPQRSLGLRAVSFAAVLRQPARSPNFSSPRDTRSSSVLPRRFPGICRAHSMTMRGGGDQPHIVPAAWLKDNLGSVKVLDASWWEFLENWNIFSAYWSFLVSCSLFWSVCGGLFFSIARLPKANPLDFKQELMKAMHHTQTLIVESTRLGSMNGIRCFSSDKTRGRAHWCVSASTARVHARTVRLRHEHSAREKGVRCMKPHWAGNCFFQAHICGVICTSSWAAHYTCIAMFALEMGDQCFYDYQ